MPAPELMFEHGFDAKKGWFDMSALDFHAKLSPNVTFEVPRGRVVHVNEDGDFEMGCHQTAPPIFLLNGSADFDVSNPGTTAKGNFMHKAIAPAGNMSGLVALGAYELDDTEFDVDQVYLVGQLLTAIADNDDVDVGGVITNQGSGAGGKVQQFVDAVCGIVSGSAPKRNHNNVQTLAFWTYFLPGAFA